MLISLSTLLHGTQYEKLQWTFRLGCPLWAFLLDFRFNWHQCRLGSPLERRYLRFSNQCEPSGFFNLFCFNFRFNERQSRLGCPLWTFVFDFLFNEQQSGLGCPVERCFFRFSLQWAVKHVRVSSLKLFCSILSRLRCPLEKRFFEFRFNEERRRLGCHLFAFHRCKKAELYWENNVLYLDDFPAVSIAARLTKVEQNIW